MRASRVSGIWAAFLLALVGASTYAKPLISDGDVTVEQVGGCDQAVAVQVKAPNADYFSKETVALQKLLGGARMVLSFQCPGVTRLDIAGVAAGNQVYTGNMAADSGWRLESSSAQAPAVPATAVATPAVAPPATATASTPAPAPPPATAGGFGSPKPDYLSAFKLVMATHSDILASDDAWVKGWASYHLFDSADPATACYEWAQVEQLNPITWKKQLNETRAKFRAALTASASRPKTATYSLFDGIFTPQYDASKGGFLVKALVNNDGTVRTLQSSNTGHPGACVPAPPIPIRLTNVPKKPEWFIAIGEADAEDFIDRTTNLTQGAKPEPNSQSRLNVQTVIQTLPPVFSNGKIHIPAKVIQVRLAVVKTTKPKPIYKPGAKPVTPPKIETVGWTFPLGMPTNIAIAAAPDTGVREVPILGQADFFLAALKHQPELLTDKVLLGLTLNQLYQEQRKYAGIDQTRKSRKMLNRPALAEVLFVWQTDRTARPEIASRMTDALVHADPDWSYLKAGGYDERKESLVANFVFSREAIMGHDAKFLQHELKDVMRDFLLAAAVRTPSEFAIDYDVPIKYDYASGMLSFPQVQGRGHGAGKPSIKQEQPLYFDDQPANSKEYGGNVYPTAVRDDFLYRPPQMPAEQVAGHNYPGGRQHNVRSLVAPRDAWPMLGFKQQLALADTAVPKAKAEPFVSSGRVTVRVIATFDGAALGARSVGGSGEQRALFAVLMGSIERIEFVDRKGRVQFTKAGSSLPVARDGNQFAQPSSATPNPIVFTRDVMDLLLLKYAPEKVDDDYLFSMMLARYSTDAASEDENWLRFFAPLTQAGRQPTEQEMRELMPQFKKWVQGRAALVNEVVALMYLKVTPGAPPVVTFHQSPQTCLYGPGNIREPDPQQTTLTLGPCGKRGKIAGEVRGLPGIKAQHITKLNPAIRIRGQLPVTAAIGADGRTTVKAQLRLRFTGVTTQGHAFVAHEATLEEILYLDATSDAEIASISGAEAAATAQAAATAKATARASQRAACESLVGVDEQMACFKANCDVLFDDRTQCQNYIGKFRNVQRMHVGGCEERAREYQLVRATPAYDVAVQTCLKEPVRDVQGPDVLGVQLGMDIGRAHELVRSALDMGNSRGYGDTIDKRPFTYLMLYHTEDTNHAVGLFYLKLWGPQNEREMSVEERVAGISRKVHFESAPPAGAVRDGLVKKYGKPTWENGGTEMMWAKSASCRGLNDVLVPLDWRARFWPADRTVRMVSPDAPQAAFETYKDCGPVVFATLNGNELETWALDPDWFRYLPEKAFKVEKGSSELKF